jgi:glycosyltransferase involved in cell wall biosynthesis
LPVEEPQRVGYIVKRYPRFSETFIVTEILAHEEAGLSLDIFSLYPPVDTHFQDTIARVRAPVNYVPDSDGKSLRFWEGLCEAAADVPGLWSSLDAAKGEEARDVFQAAVIARLARRKGIRHLHAHFGSAATTVARLAARFGGLTYSFTAHAKDIYHESVRPDDLRRKLADASAVVTVSDYNLEYLRAEYGEAAARVRRIYNGIDLERFPYSAPRDRPPMVVYVGRLVEKKGLPDLIDACAMLAARGKTLECGIVGAGELEAELAERIARLGVGSTVRLLGPRPQAEVIRLIREASAVAAPCVIGEDGNRDGLPTVILEAMALGTPCVSTDVTGIPEVVRHGETGLIVPQHDPAALADALERLASDSALRVSLAVRARERIGNDFDIRRNAAKIRGLFREAAAERAATA